MRPSHYADLMIREGAVAHDLHARLLLAAHYRIAAGDRLAVCWPDWRDQPGEFGLLFRVFGEPAALQSYLDSVAPLQAAALVRFYAPQAVPANATRSIRFLRDRSHDKLSPSVARRLTRRAAARGETWASTHAGELRDAGNHYLAIPSISQQQMFRLYVRRDHAATDGAGARYGLGFTLPDF